MAKLDLLLVNAPGKKKVYQALANDLAAYEPPIWAGLIAGFIRKHGYSVKILDAEALDLTTEQTAKEIDDLDPRLCVFTVYGQQPSASTQSMPAAIEVCKLVTSLTMFLGTHPSALPEQTLRESHCDLVCEGEGPYTILGLLKYKDYEEIPGLWWQDGDVIEHNPVAPKIQNLNEEIPDMAWDLLPMDKYRAHNWHCWDHIDERKPYASIYTSLGCPYKCSFCCINAPFGGAGIRYFSPRWVIAQLDQLVNKYGVKNIKFADEMFVLNPQHVLDICDLIIERKYDLNIWAYARIDTVKDRYLEKLKNAGFNWLGIGIESGSKHVRDGVEKGRFGDEEIIKTVKKIEEHGINVGANYIFGLPDDTLQSMQSTLDLAIALNTEYANFYCAMAYPGSPLHRWAIEKGTSIPESDGGPGWIGYSQHAYETLPLATETLSSGEVLSFRDKAFTTYFTNPSYLEMISRKFGPLALKHIKEMTAIKLERKYDKKD